MAKLKSFLFGASKLIAFCLFFIVCLKIFSKDIVGVQNQLLAFLAGIAVMFFFNYKLSRLKITKTVYWVLILIMFLMTAAWHWYFAKECQVDFIWGDSANVIKNAQSLASTGEYLADGGRDGIPYFSQYQNQFGILLLYRLVFTITNALFDSVSPDYLLILNYVTVECSVVLTVLLAERIGRELSLSYMGLRTMFLCMLAPFLYLYIPLFYTDVLCLPFILGGILLERLLVGFAQRKSQKKLVILLLFAIFGFFLGLGYKVKGNILILLVATVISLFLELDFKTCVRATGAMAAGLVVLSLLFSFYLSHSGLLTKENSDRYKFPATHWIMMAMDHMGYSEKDIKFTMSFPTYEEKSNAIKERIKQKYEKMGLSKLISHAFDKAAFNAWDRGDFNAPTYLGELSSLIPPLKNSWIHEIILSKGAYNKTFKLLTNTFWYLLLFPMVAAYLMDHRKRSMTLFLAQIFLFGTLIFFMLWETDHRYIFCVSPVVLVCGAAAWVKFLRIPPIIKYVRTHHVCDYPLFTERESKIRALLQNGEFTEAQNQYDQYNKLIRYILPVLSNENAYTIRKRKEELAAAVEENRGALDFCEKVDIYCELWTDTSRLTRSEMKIVIKNGVELLAESDSLKSSNDAKVAEKRLALLQKIESLKQTIE